MAKKRKKKGRRSNSTFRKVVIAIIVVIFLLAGFGIQQQLYHRVYQPNVIVEKSSSPYFYIHTDADYKAVMDSLYDKGYIRNRNTFTLDS